MMRSKRIIYSLLQFILMMLILQGSLVHADNRVEEYTLKAALLIKLTRFVYLPENHAQSDTLNICVIGHNPFEQILNKMSQQAGSEKPIVIHEISNINPQSHCHFSFISQSANNNLTSILNTLKQQQSVTISDIDGFAKQGGMIELSLNDGESIEILINRTAADEQSVQFNAQLLRLATLIKP